MSNLFWLTVEQLASIQGAIPMNRGGVKPRRNREVISGISHVLKVGGLWEDCPSEYGPHITVYNQFNRWSKAGIWALGRHPRRTRGFRRHGRSMHRQHNREGPPLGDIILSIPWVPCY